MTWFHAAGGQQTGPFTNEQFAELIASGKVQPSTLVWQEKLPNWIPLAQVPRELLPPMPSTTPLGAGPAPAAALPRCSNCGAPFSPDNLVQIENALVCANCKPIVLNRIKEGFNPLNTAVTPDELIHRIDSENRRLDVGNCFSIAWDLYKNAFWPTVGVTVVVFLVMMAGGAMPVIGSCVSLVITGPLMGGLYLYFLKRIRGQQATIGDGFGGFTTCFLQLMLASVVTSILAYLPLAPFGIYFFARNMDADVQGFEFGPVDVIFLILGIVVSLFLVVAWIFVLPLVIDKQLNFWPAMGTSWRAVVKRLGPVILLMLATMGVALLGLLACGVGLIFAGPLVIGAYAVAYEFLFGDQQPLAPSAHG
jgi:hypothetical protein